MGDVFKAGADAIAHINNELQIIGLVVICVFAVVILWMLKLSGESKKLIEVKDAAAKKLIEEKEAAEKERTKHRKKERDAEINGIAARFDAEAKRLEAKLDNHLDDHKINDEKTQKSVESIDTRLRRIEANLIERKEFIDLCEKVNVINLGVVKMVTIYEERSKHEHNA